MGQLHITATQSSSTTVHIANNKKRGCQLGAQIKPFTLKQLVHELAPSTTTAAHMLLGQADGSLIVFVSSIQQVSEGLIMASQVGVDGIALQGGAGLAGKALQLQLVLPGVQLAMRHHHVGQFQIIHTQGCPGRGSTRVQLEP